MKKTLSLLLALVMVLSLVPFGAFAAETLTLAIGENTAVLDGSDAGLEYTWEAPENGTLTITMPEDAENGWEYSVLTAILSALLRLTTVMAMMLTPMRWAKFSTA